MSLRRRLGRTFEGARRRRAAGNRDAHSEGASVTESQIVETGRMPPGAEPPRTVAERREELGLPPESDSGDRETSEARS